MFGLETASAGRRRPDLRTELAAALEEFREIETRLRSARGTDALQLQRKRSTLQRSIKALRNAVGREEEQKRLASRHRAFLDRFGRP